MYNKRILFYLRKKREREREREKDKGVGLWKKKKERKKEEGRESLVFSMAYLIFDLFTKRPSNNVSFYNTCFKHPNLRILTQTHNKTSLPSTFFLFFVLVHSFQYLNITTKRAIGCSCSHVWGVWMWTWKGLESKMRKGLKSTKK